MLTCVKRASLAPPPSVTAVWTWTPLPLDAEQLITGRADALQLSAPLRRLADAADDREELFYGWPLLIVRDQGQGRGRGRGRDRVAPLLITQLQRPDCGEDTVLASDEPVLNPALLTEDFFPPDVLAGARDAVAGDPAFGDPAALTAQAAAVLHALDLDGSLLDPQRLQPAAQPTAPGVYNVAVAYRGTANAATEGLVGELEQLLARTDWPQTAARWLRESPPPVELPDSPAPAAPKPLNDSQEQALAATAFLPVTVVTGPPGTGTGTGKSHLVAATVAAAWLRGDTVLVASTNNTAVNEAVSKAHGRGCQQGPRRRPRPTGPHREPRTARDCARPTDRARRPDRAARPVCRRHAPTPRGRGRQPRRRSRGARAARRSGRRPRPDRPGPRRAAAHPVGRPGTIPRAGPLRAVGPPRPPGTARPALRRRPHPPPARRGRDTSRPARRSDRPGRVGR